eukprot:gene21094-27336_t
MKIFETIALLVAGIDLYLVVGGMNQQVMIHLHLIYKHQVCLLI